MTCPGGNYTGYVRTTPSWPVQVDDFTPFALTDAGTNNYTRWPVEPLAVPVSGFGQAPSTILGVSTKTVLLVAGVVALLWALQLKGAKSRNRGRRRRRNPGRDLRQRIADTIGWSREDTKGFSMQSLRELVRDKDPALASEISEHIRSGRYIMGKPLRPRPRRRNARRN